MIQLHDISLSFGGQRVLDRLSWGIKPNERIGLIGKNGAGKSTLLRIISGEIKPDEGRVQIGARTSIGYLEQDVQALNSDAPVIEEAMAAFGDLLALDREEERLTRELEAFEDHEDPAYERLLHALERVHTEMAAQEAHLARPRAEAVLTGLGFDPDDLERPIKSFSGGWRMRVMLARLLLQRPDYLLLDEPTNHLDIESIDWLEGYLKAYEGTVVMVSHDRYFLDRMITSIAELAHGKIAEYAGNYSFYLVERENRRVIQQAAHENQQREIADIERFIERFRYKASKARQVQSRIKLLEKMERIPPPESEDAAVKIRFPDPPRSGRVVLELSRFSKTYDSSEGRVEVFRDAGPLTIERGDKIALIGKNGAGKSTLARMLNGTEPFDGERSLGYNVELSFFAQHQGETLDAGDDLLSALRKAGPGKSDREIRTLLGAFLFSGDNVFKKIGVLSGGEKSRVALARTLLHPANFLILDEPTNHLDAQSIAVLIDALQQFTGTFVVVSHDRHFLDQIANNVWYVAGGGVKAYPGNYSDFRWHIEHGTARVKPDGDALEAADSEAVRSTDPEAAASGGSGSSLPNGLAAGAAQAGRKPERKPSGGPKSKEQKRREAEERNRLYRALQRGRSVDADGLTGPQLKAYYEQIEHDVVEKERAIAELESRLADPEIYADGERVRDLNARYERAKNELDVLYEKWEDLAAKVAERETQ